MGSSQDLVIREFLTLEAQKEIEKQRLLLNLTIANVGGKNKEWVDDITAHFNTYASLELGIETNVKTEVVTLETEEMLEVYNRIKQIPIMARKIVGPGGKPELVVDGISKLGNI